MRGWGGTRRRNRCGGWCWGRGTELGDSRGCSGLCCVNNDQGGEGVERVEVSYSMVREGAVCCLVGLGLGLRGVEGRK